MSVEWTKWTKKKRCPRGYVGVYQGQELRRCEKPLMPVKKKRRRKRV